MNEGEGQLHRALLCSTLHEAGVVSLGYSPTVSQTDEPDLFQVTAWGASALRESSDLSSDPLLTSAALQLIVQPNLDLVLMQFESELIYRLIQFAEVRRIGPASTFTLTQPALLRGLEAGNQLEDLLAFLTKVSQRSLPQNVEYTLRDWARGYKEAHISSVLLIELLPIQNEADLHRALAGLEIKVRQVAPGMFALAAESISFPSLRKRLEKEGLVVRGKQAPEPRWKSAPY